MSRVLRVLGVAAACLFHVGNAAAVLVTSAYRNVHISDVTTGEVADSTSTGLGEFSANFGLTTPAAGASAQPQALIFSTLSLSEHALGLHRATGTESIGTVNATGSGSIGSTTIDLRFVTDASALSVAMDVVFGHPSVGGPAGNADWSIRLIDVTGGETNIFSFDSASPPSGPLSLSLVAGNAYRFLAINQAFGRALAASAVGFDLTETTAPAAVPVPASGLLLAAGLALGLRRRGARLAS